MDKIYKYEWVKIASVYANSLQYRRTSVVSKRGGKMVHTQINSESVSVFTKQSRFTLFCSTYKISTNFARLLVVSACYFLFFKSL